jgi:two-component system chemotaxis response regulator CheB
MIRVLIVDDSPTARVLLRTVLGADPDLRIVGEASGGAEAVALTCSLRPNVITMDLRMPDMDGLEATKEIMIVAPTPIVIVTASAAVDEVETGLAALRAGALTVLAKPPGPGSPGFEDAARELVATVKAMAHVKVVRHWRRSAPTARAAKDAEPAEAGPQVQVIAIAASTGGPAALLRLVSDLPGDFPVPILVVQHITPGFVGGLAEWLTKAGNLHVKVARDGEPLAPHTVYLAPDDFHLGVAPSNRIGLSQAAPVGVFRPSATFLFESVARLFGQAAVGVILTGMGEDGVEGLRALRQAGGRVLAQDEKSSVIFGMPGAAIAAGLADAVLSVDAIAARLVRWVKP